jgi:hypothetical protein
MFVPTGRTRGMLRRSRQFLEELLIPHIRRILVPMSRQPVKEEQNGSVPIRSRTKRILTLRTHAMLVLGRQHSTIFLTTPPVRGGGGDLCLAPPRSSLLSFVGGNGGARRCVRARGMGKEDGGGQQPSAAGAEGGRSGGGAGGGTRCSGWRRAVRPQCVAALLLGAAVALSALFWLPPFAGRGSRAGPPDPGSALAGQLAFRLPRSRAYLASSFLSSRFHF